MENQFNPYRFKQARELSRETQASLAEKLGVSEQTIQYWEAGRTVPPHEVLEEMSMVFGIVLPDFFYRGDPPSFPMGSLLIHEWHGYKRYGEDEEGGE
jgi:DNA-binding XRE family transcriptional regulator